MSSRHALVVGASGLARWGIANVLLDQYPPQGAFEKVTALVNRLMTVEEAYWPQHSGRPTLNLVSGVDLTKGSADGFTALINEKVSDFSTVTHVFTLARTFVEMSGPSMLTTLETAYKEGGPAHLETQ